MGCWHWSKVVSRGVHKRYERFSLQFPDLGLLCGQIRQLSVYRLWDLFLKISFMTFDRFQNIRHKGCRFEMKIVILKLEQWKLSWYWKMIAFMFKSYICKRITTFLLKVFDWTYKIAATYLQYKVKSHFNWNSLLF